MTKTLAPFVAAAAMVAGALLGQGALAARLPDWAEPVAESAPPAPEGVPKHPSQVLLSETRCAIQPDGTKKIRRRFASQALSSAMRDVALGFFAFGDNTKINASRAWHVRPGERAKRSWDTPVDLTLDDSFLTDSKTRVLGIDGIKKGSLVFFEFEATKKPYFLPERHLFYEGAPVQTARFEVEVPPGWRVEWDWLRQAGPEPLVVGGTYTWEMKDLPAPEREPLSRDPADAAPWLAVNFVPPADYKGAPAAFTDWASVSRWETDLAAGRADVTPQIQDAARKVLGPAGEDLFGIIAAAGLHVRDSVRYVAIELGIGGYQPAPAAETLSNLYGDCKAKATLLQALLGAEGRTVYPVVVSLGTPDTVSEKIPDPGAFNHVVAAIPIPADAAVPPSFAPAVVDAGDLGRLLIVDATDERTSIGSLSAHLAGKRALVAAGERGRLVALPVGSPSAHGLVRRLTMDLRPDRSVAAERVSHYTGDYSWYARQAYSSSSVDRRKAIERRIMGIWPGATVTDYAAEYETPEGAYVETIMLTLRPLHSTGSGAKLEVFPGAADDLPRVPLGRRKTPVEYDHPFTIRHEVTIRGLPETVTLPSPHSSQGEGWTVATAYAREGDAVKASWEVTLSRTRWAQEAFPDLRKFWSAAGSAASPVLTLPG